MDFSRFDDVQERLLQYGLAGFLEISPDSVVILKKSSGSTKVVVAIPRACASKVIRAFNENDANFQEALGKLEISKIHFHVSSDSSQTTSQVKVKEAAENTEPEAESLLELWKKGEKIQITELILVFKEDLRRLARTHLDSAKNVRALTETGVISEFYLFLLRQDVFQWKDKSHFLLVAAAFMRRIVVEADAIRDFPGEVSETRSKSVDPAGKLEDVFRELSSLNSTQGQIVDLRFFLGLSAKETAAVLGIEEKTVQSEWSSAKNWLQMRLIKE